MEQLKIMKEMLMGCAQGQMGHLDTVDAKELGEVIDMIKDLSEAIYYCTITEAMTKKEEEEPKYYPMMDEYYRDMDKMKGRMYYNGNGKTASGNSGSYNGSTSSHNGTRGYSERLVPFEDMMHDTREGRSWQSRKTYMESKEMHKDKSVQLQELEKYAQELTTDMVEMIQDATPEEKQYLSNRIAALATKIK